MRVLWVAFPAVCASVALACHHAAPVAETTPQPNADSIALAERARQDSIARAEAERRAREEAERLAERRRADSLADLRRSAEEAMATLTTMIHFDFDKSDIRPGDAQVLDQKVPLLRANPSVRVQIAGNCDERGSDEYNLALGNRRAVSAKTYLVSHGIDASRIETVSYGEERPIDPRHDEEGWAVNRNDQFTVLNPDVVRRLP